MVPRDLIAAVSPGAPLREGGGERRFALAADRVLKMLQRVGEPAGAAQRALLTDLRALARSGSDLILRAGADGRWQLASPTRSLAVPAFLREALLALARSAGAPAAAGSASGPVAQPATGPAGETSVHGQWLARASALVRAAGAEPDVARMPQKETRALFEGAPGRVPDALGAAGRLRFSVELSGLFYESHLRQWVKGQRAEPLLRREAVRLLSSAPAVEPADDALPGGAQRLAAQLAVIENDAVQLNLPAWSGQRIELVVGRAPDRPQPPGTDDPVHEARLMLELPRLGPVAARLRLAGGAMALQIECSKPAPLEAALGQLKEQLAARGIEVAMLAVQEAA